MQILLLHRQSLLQQSFAPLLSLVSLACGVDGSGSSSVCIWKLCKPSSFTFEWFIVATLANAKWAWRLNHHPSLPPSFIPSFLPLVNQQIESNFHQHAIGIELVWSLGRSFLYYLQTHSIPLTCTPHYSVEFPEQFHWFM